MSKRRLLRWTFRASIAAVWVCAFAAALAADTQADAGHAAAFMWFVAMPLLLLGAALVFIESNL